MVGCQAILEPATQPLSDGTLHMLFDIGFRIVAVAACIYSGDRVWNGLQERKITLTNDDWLDWSKWATPTFERDVAPIRYWMTMTMGTGGTVLCFIAAIVGYWQPNS